MVDKINWCQVLDGIAWKYIEDREQEPELPSNVKLPMIRPRSISLGCIDFVNMQISKCINKEFLKLLDELEKKSITGFDVGTDLKYCGAGLDKSSRKKTSTLSNRKYIPLSAIQNLRKKLKEQEI